MHIAADRRAADSLKPIGTESASSAYSRANNCYICGAQLLFVLFPVCVYIWFAYLLSCRIFFLFAFASLHGCVLYKLFDTHKNGRQILKAPHIQRKIQIFIHTHTHTNGQKGQTYHTHTHMFTYCEAFIAEDRARTRI